MFVEPGFSFSRGNHTFSFNVPIGYYYHRYPDPNTGLEGDATFPRQVFLTSYSLKLGRKTALPPAVTAPSPDAAPLPDPPVEAGEDFVRLDLSGMTCEQCVETVRSALAGMDGVIDAKVSLGTMQAVVTYRTASVTVNDLLKTVTNAKGMNQYTATVHKR